MAVNYVVYIDESGDPGLSGIVSNNGTNDWMVLSAFVVRQCYDTEVQQWADEIRGKFKNSQRRDIHFSDLIPAKKRIACEMIATKPCRYFFVASHKENMRSYRNERIKVPGGAWYYWWLSRILLERVTAFCYARSSPISRARETMRIIFSKRGGLKYADFVQYMRKIERQSRAGRLFLKHGDLVWSMIDYDEVRVLPHAAHAGLQMADVGAGAFYQAVTADISGEFHAEFLKALTPIIAKDAQGTILNCGVKVMPKLSDLALKSDQRMIFEYFGYNPNGWLADAKA